MMCSENFSIKIGQKKDEGGSAIYYKRLLPTLNLLGPGVFDVNGLSLASSKNGVPSISPQVIRGDSPTQSGPGVGVETNPYPPTLGVGGPISLPSTSTRPISSETKWPR